MYEEDRQRALSMYSDMFDTAVNEQELIQKLNSPTRQAVLVARAYNAKTRGLTTDIKSSGEAVDNDTGEIPAYIITINKLREEIFSPAEEEPEERKEFDDQLSMFDTDPFAVIEAEALEEEEAEEAEEIEESEIVEEPESVEEPSLIIEESVEEPQEISEEEPIPESTEEDPSDSVAEIVESSDDTSSVSEDEIDSKDEVSEVSEETPDEEPVIPAVRNIEEIFSASDPEPADERKPVRKPKVFLLILYILFAIPVTAVGIAVLLIPTVICLAIAAVSIFSGVAVISAAFSGFSVIADLLVIVGLSIVLLAVGLLFLWAFLWFIVGAIIGLIRGVCELGGKWCYKEEQDNG